MKAYTLVLVAVMLSGCAQPENQAEDASSSEKDNGKALVQVMRAQDAPQYIQIGDVHLTLGQPKQQVKEMLSYRYNVNEYASDAVVVKEKYETDPTKDVCSMWFKDSKLDHVARSWGQFENQKATTLADALFRAISYINKTDETKATIEAVRDVSPDTDADNIILRFGRRSIRIISQRPGDGRKRSLDVYEYLSNNGI